MGTVVNVFNSGANDLLHVMLNSTANVHNGIGKEGTSETEATGPLVWIPFVEAIVPSVDMNKREMHITPPKGLLNLNVRTDERSKKERRQLVRHTPFYSTFGLLVRHLMTDFNPIHIDLMTKNKCNKRR